MLSGWHDLLFFLHVLGLTEAFWSRSDHERSCMVWGVMHMKLHKTLSFLQMSNTIVSKHGTRFGGRPNHLFLDTFGPVINILEDIIHANIYNLQENVRYSETHRS